MNMKIKYLSLLLALIVAVNVLGIQTVAYAYSTAESGMSLVANGFPAVDNSSLVYEGNKVISPVMPYEDQFSLFTKLPLAHTKSTGKGVNIGYIGNESEANRTYWVARDSKVYACSTLSVEVLKSQGITVAAVEDINKYDIAALKKFAADCISANITVVIDGSKAVSEDRITMVNDLEKLGVIVAGEVQTVDLGTYIYDGNGTRAINVKIEKINVNVFAPDMENGYALPGVLGAAALVKQLYPQLDCKGLKDYIISKSRSTWQSRGIDGSSFVTNNISIDSVSGFLMPTADSAVFKYKLLDFEKLLDIQISPQWSSNILNCAKAWSISRGNTDVAVIDMGFYSDRTDIKDNIVDRQVFGNRAFSEYKEWHGSSMIQALLSVAPDAKVHALVADTFVASDAEKITNLKNAIDYCINNKIGIISTSMGSWANDPSLMAKIREAVDKGIVFSWFAYDGEYAGVLKSSCFWDKNSGPFVLDRFIDKEDAMPENSSWGRSPTAPQVAGMAAILRGNNPALSPADIANILKSNSYILPSGAYIPDLYKSMSVNNDYYQILYHKTKLSSNDLTALKDYARKLGNSNQYDVILKDTSPYKTAVDILKSMKADAKYRKGKLLGVQIIGSAEDVPAFNIHFKVKMQQGIDDAGFFNSDLFYSNFDSDEAALANDFSIYKTFEEKLNISFVPKWSVARLPLKTGEVAEFINKYYDYGKLVVAQGSIPYVNFSNPIFAYKDHTDDMGYFLKERMDEEFGILKSSDYKLYGNQLGLFPVSTQVLDGFDNQRLKTENEKGIANFIINSHGQWDNIDNCIFTGSSDAAKYKDVTRESRELGNGTTEIRIPFLNLKNVNTILSKNYYTLTLWTCLNGYDLRSDNLAHAALMGNAVSVTAASSTISNNGVNNNVSLEEMKKNNFYYFMYEYIKAMKEGSSPSESFFHAKKAYATEILKNTDLLFEGNYGFNLHNVLSYHYLGLLDIPQAQNTGKITLPTNDIMPDQSQQGTTNGSNGQQTGNTSNQQTGGVKHVVEAVSSLTFSKLAYGYLPDNTGINVQEVSYAVDSKYVYIKVKYNTPIVSIAGVFLQGDAPGLKEFISNTNKKGDIEFLLGFTKDELRNYSAGIAINLGGRNFIFLDKALTDSLCSVESTKLTNTGSAENTSSEGQGTAQNTSSESQNNPQNTSSEGQSTSKNTSSNGQNTAQNKLQPKAAIKLKGIQPSVSTINVKKGKTASIKVFASYSNGTKTDVTRKAKWTTSSKTVTCKNGVVKAVAVAAAAAAAATTATGKSKITVSYGGFSKMVIVNVTK